MVQYPRNDHDHGACYVKGWYVLGVYLLVAIVRAQAWVLLRCSFPSVFPGEGAG
jgi:hypothetical protein